MPFTSSLLQTELSCGQLVMPPLLHLHSWSQLLYTSGTGHTVQ
jgi:hypothetical protein